MARAWSLPLAPVGRAGWPSLQQTSPAAQVELEQAFKLFDADQSGYVTADEIRSLMCHAGGDEALTDAEVEELIKMADPDRDGKISFDEFKDMECWKIPESSLQPRLIPRSQDPGAAAPPTS